LVLLMGVIYEVHHCDGLRWHDMHTKFHEGLFGHSDNIKVITSTISEAIVLVLVVRTIIYVTDMASGSIMYTY
jgi:hypothetical protein